MTPAAVTITQTAPTSGSVTTTGSAAFTDQLNTTGNNGPVTFTRRRWNGPHRLVQRQDHHDRQPGGGHLHGDRDHGRRLR